jgi:hypothetical protein
MLMQLILDMAMALRGHVVLDPGRDGRRFVWQIGLTMDAEDGTHTSLSRILSESARYPNHLPIALRISHMPPQTVAKRDSRGARWI